MPITSSRASRLPIPGFRTALGLLALLLGACSDYEVEQLEATLWMGPGSKVLEFELRSTIPFEEGDPAANNGDWQAELPDRVLAAARGARYMNLGLGALLEFDFDALAESSEPDWSWLWDSEELSRLVDSALLRRLSVASASLARGAEDRALLTQRFEYRRLDLLLSYWSQSINRALLGLDGQDRGQFEAAVGQELGPGIAPRWFVAAAEGWKWFELDGAQLIVRAPLTPGALARGITGLSQGGTGDEDFLALLAPASELHVAQGVLTVVFELPSDAPQAPAAPGQRPLRWVLRWSHP